MVVWLIRLDICDNSMNGKWMSCDDHLIRLNSSMSNNNSNNNWEESYIYTTEYNNNNTFDVCCVQCMHFYCSIERRRKKLGNLVVVIIKWFNKVSWWVLTVCACACACRYCCLHTVLWIIFCIQMAQWYSLSIFWLCGIELLLLLLFLSFVRATKWHQQLWQLQFTLIAKETHTLIEWMWHTVPAAAAAAT